MPGEDLLDAWSRALTCYVNLVEEKQTVRTDGSLRVKGNSDILVGN